MNTRPGRHVVAGVDGSDTALRAVRWAAEEARDRGIGLLLLHVVELPTGYGPRVVDPRVLHEALTDRGEGWLTDARQVAEETVSGVHVDVVLEVASPVPALVQASREATLLVLGSRGLGGFSGLLVGSTAVAVAGRARCPMVVVRGRYAAEPVPVAGPVVVGVDGTTAGEAAVEFAFAEASMRGADLVAVHAWTDLLIEAGYVGGAAVLDFEPLEQRVKETLAERLAGWPERCPDVRVTREVVRDRPSRALLRHGEHARLLVVGSRGRGGFQGLVLGSTSRHLLHHAACPVAVVRSAPES